MPGASLPGLLGNMGIRWRPHHGTLAALCAVCLLTYGNSLHGGFLFDDNYAVLDNHDVTQPAVNFTALLQNDFWGQSMTSASSHKSYRCVVLASVDTLPDCSKSAWMDIKMLGNVSLPV